MRVPWMTAMLLASASCKATPAALAPTTATGGPAPAVTSEAEAEASCAMRACAQLERAGFARDCRRDCDRLVPHCNASFSSPPSLGAWIDGGSVQCIDGILMYETIRDETEQAAGGERWVFPDGHAAVTLPRLVVASDEARVIIAFEQKSGPIPAEVQSSARAVIGHFDASLWGSSSDTAPAPSR